MSKKHFDLGLPIEYQQLPEYFDAHNINESTDTKNALIERLLREQNIKTILDMTCGTGSQVFYLDDHGYEIIGNDFSPALIKSARHKAKLMKREITFLNEDMRTIKAGKFDAVITIFNAIGHLTKADFNLTLQNIQNNLKDNGIYVFDILNLQAITDEIIKNFTMNIESTLNGVKFTNSQHSEIDREHGLLISHDKYTITKPDSKPEMHNNTFSLQIYTSQELNHILQKNGFQIVKQYDMEGCAFNPETSLSILTVAKKRA